MPLWSAMVVKIQAHGSGSGWSTASLPAKIALCTGWLVHVWSAVHQHRTKGTGIYKSGNFSREL